MTPSDYTVYFYIDKEQSKIFQTHFYDNTKEKSRGMQFREWIWHQIAVFRTPENNEKIKIARMDLVFDNADIIKLLK